MSECEYLQGCPFFNDRTGMELSELVVFVKQKFCHGDYTHCARYIVAFTLGEKAVPLDMTPVHLVRAQEILSEHSATVGQ